MVDDPFTRFYNQHCITGSECSESAPVLLARCNRGLSKELQLTEDEFVTRLRQNGHDLTPNGLVAGIALRQPNRAKNAFGQQSQISASAQYKQSQWLLYGKQAIKAEKLGLPTPRPPIPLFADNACRVIKLDAAGVAIEPEDRVLLDI